MTKNEAIAILTPAFRGESRDHYFGDREIFWYPVAACNPDGSYEGEALAEGYFSRSCCEVTMADGTVFTGDDARALAKLGAETLIGRNDSSDDDVYRGA